jgi:hypothetical protein
LVYCRKQKMIQQTSNFNLIAKSDFLNSAFLNSKV